VALRDAQERVRACADRVLEAELEAHTLLKEASELQTQFIHQRLLLRLLHSSVVTDDVLKKQIATFLRAPLPGVAGAVDVVMSTQHPTVRMFDEMRAALALNADAEIADRMTGNPTVTIKDVIGDPRRMGVL
jgi:hypothetical protein